MEWGNEQERAFQALKESLSTELVLALPDLDNECILCGDASAQGLGAILLQEVGGEKHPVASASGKLAPRKQHYSAIERECLAIV